VNDEAALNLHKRLKGKIATSLRSEVTPETLRLLYTPGVGAVSSYVAEHPETLRDYTWTNNLVAIISDGSAVLGLGNIGPEGAMPVMEGKAMLFKHFADVDAVPIVLNVHSAEEIVNTITAMASSFGGINLEDIAAPICFEVEDRLKEMLNIPVMHDDQHATAIVVLAGLINSLRLKNVAIEDLRIVVAGAGAAGVAVAKLLNVYGSKNILVVDSKGIIGPDRQDLNNSKRELLESNGQGVNGSLEDALRGADVFIGVSKARLLTKEHIKMMAEGPVIFALANPVPEIEPEEAKEAGAFIVATGRSDFPNQINNVLVFPGIFRGALDNRVNRITDQHKLSAAKAIAALVESPSPDNIIPSVFDDRVASVVAAVIK
jgi:malate dehydrogenase (oxaloacetate-decarboxylating)